MKMRCSKGRAALISITMACVLAAVFFVLLKRFRPRQPDLEPPPASRVAVTTMRVDPAAMDDVVVFPGQVEAWSDVWVAVEQGGRVAATPVDTGDRVEAGASVLQVDDRLRKTALERAELQARDARRDRERLHELRETGAVSASEFDRVELRADQAEIALREARVQWERCTPRAPMGGVVEARAVSVGEHVQPGQKIVRLVDAETVKVQFDVPERDVASVQKGAGHRFRLDSAPDEAFVGVVRYVSTVAHEENNAYRVELTVPNPEGRLRPGMIGQVDLVRGTVPDAILLPLEAIVPMRGETVAYVVEDGRAMRRVVRLGGFFDADALVREGIEAGDEVILDGNRAVLDGTPVQVQPAIDSR